LAESKKTEGRCVDAGSIEKKKIGNGRIKRKRGDKG